VVQQAVATFSAAFCVARAVSGRSDRRSMHVSQIDHELFVPQSPPFPTAGSCNEPVTVLVLFVRLLFEFFCSPYRVLANDKPASSIACNQRPSCNNLIIIIRWPPILSKKRRRWRSNSGGGQGEPLPFLGSPLLFRVAT
jgi:hypothetical protein